MMTKTWNCPLNCHHLGVFRFSVNAFFPTVCKIGLLDWIWQFCSSRLSVLDSEWFMKIYWQKWNIVLIIILFLFIYFCYLRTLFFFFFFNPGPAGPCPAWFKGAFRITSFFLFTFSTYCSFPYKVQSVACIQFEHTTSSWPCVLIAVKSLAWNFDIKMLSDI